MTSRKDQLKNLFQPAAAAQPQPAQPQRAASGAVKAMGLSLGSLQRELDEVRALEGERILEIDPQLIDASPYADRLSDGANGDEDFVALIESIRTGGQQVPVLVRAAGRGAIRPPTGTGASWPRASLASRSRPSCATCRIRPCCWPRARRMPSGAISPSLRRPSSPQALSRPACRALRFRRRFRPQGGNDTAFAGRRVDPAADCPCIGLHPRPGARAGWRLANC